MIFKLRFPREPASVFFCESLFVEHRYFEHWPQSTLSIERFEHWPQYTNVQVVMEEEPIVVGPNQETTPVILTIIIVIVLIVLWKHI